MAVGAESYPRSVYTIKNTKTGKIYVGSSCKPDQRFEAHMSKLRHGNHTVKDMQKDYEQYGDCFEFAIIDEMVDPSESNKEYEWMFRMKTYDREVGYNYQDLTCRGYVRSKGVDIGRIPWSKEAKPIKQEDLDEEELDERRRVFERVSYVMQRLTNEQLHQMEARVRAFAQECQRPALVAELKEVAATADIDKLAAALRLLKGEA